MPTEFEVIRQLEHYGLWLEAEADTDLAYTPNLELELELLTIEDATRPTEDHHGSDPTSGSGWRARVLLALGAVALIGGITWFAQEPETTVATDPTPQIDDSEVVPSPDETVETVDPLFVLPSPVDGYQPLVSDVGDSAPVASGSQIIVGRPAASGYDDVSTITFVEEPATDGSSTDGSLTDIVVGGRTVQIPTGSESTPFAPFSVVVEGGGRLEFTPARPELREALLDGAGVVDGELRFEPVDGLEVLGEIDRLEDIEVRYTINRVQPLSSNPVTIYVQSHPTGAETLRFSPGDSVVTSVRGHEGLLRTMTLPTGSEHQSLSWVETSGQTITVSGLASLDIPSIADDLRVVDEDAWDTALAESAAAAIRVQLGTLPLVDEEGIDASIEADGSPTVLIAGRSSCARCLANLQAISDQFDETEPDVRFVVVRLDADDGDWGDPATWDGLVRVLPSSAPAELAEPLESLGIMLLDGDNRTVAQFDVSSEGAANRLATALASID